MLQAQHSRRLRFGAESWLHSDYLDYRGADWELVGSLQEGHLMQQGNLQQVSFAVGGLRH